MLILRHKDTLGN